MVGFAFFATVFMYLDRQVLAVVNASPAFQKAVPHTVEEYGYALSAFMLAYTISNGLSGPFIDAVGTRIGYACCMLWWSISAILHIFLRGPRTLAGFRFLIGAGEAGNWPAAAKLVSEWFPAKERALASGHFQQRGVRRQCDFDPHHCRADAVAGLEKRLHPHECARLLVAGGLVVLFSRVEGR